MILLYVYSFAFIALFLCPLWFDAHRRVEYGDRPKILLASLIVFLVAGLLSVGSFLFKLTEGPWAEVVVIFQMFLYNFVFLLAEYSVHHQRIQKNLLENEFKERLRWIFVIAGVSLALFAIVIVMRALQLSDNAAWIRIIAGWASLLCFLGAIGFHLYCIMLFDLEEGIIRRRIYLFVYGTELTVGIALVFFVHSIFNFPNTIAFFIVAVLMTLMNLLYAARVFQEYFLYRMHHLSTNYAQRKAQDLMRTELINKVLTSSPAEDVGILHDILADYLERIKKSVPNPNVRCKSMMLFRRNGDLLTVDSTQFIVDHCVPLINMVSLKRMRSENLEEFILTQIFDLAKLDNPENGEDQDFAVAAVKKMIKGKKPVYLNPLPEYLAQLFRLIILYPVYNQEKLNGMVVIFKDTSDYVFPQETVIIEELLGTLSIATTQISGKRIQEDKNRLNQEMDVAKKIQVSVLPKKIAIDGYDIDSEMITATEVGGDLYDFVPTQFGNYIDIGDVAGHGLPAGMTALIHMAAFHGAIRASETLGKELETTQLYDIINKVLIGINRDRIGSDKFMTGNVLVEKNGTFRHAGAHMIGLLYHANEGKIEELSGMIDRAAYLGISEFAESSKSLGSFSMKGGDVLILYTDGLTESRDRNDQFFGLENLKLALEVNVKLPSEQIKGAILTSLAAFSESGDLKKYGGLYADDISILVIKRN